MLAGSGEGERREGGGGLRWRMEARDLSPRLEVEARDLPARLVTERRTYAPRNPSSVSLRAAGGSAARSTQSGACFKPRRDAPHASKATSTGPLAQAVRRPTHPRPRIERERIPWVIGCALFFDGFRNRVTTACGRAAARCGIGEALDSREALAPRPDDDTRTT
jgi:hypothetical protein